MFTLHIFITNKTVNRDIVKTGIRCKLIHNSIHIYSSISKYTIKATIISAKLAHYAL
jgi:hypothetical protein